MYSHPCCRWGVRSVAQATVVASAIAGDRRAFDQIVEAYQARIARYILGLVNDEELALDLTQDTFVSAFRNIRALRSDLALSSWLYRIATNLAVQARSRKRRFIWQPLSMLEESSGPTAEAPDQLVMDRELVSTALARLPRDRAACLLLHAGEGFSYDEVAAIMNTTPEAVRKRISRAKEQFRAIYNAAARIPTSMRCAEMVELLSAYVDRQTDPQDTGLVRHTWQSASNARRCCAGSGRHAVCSTWPWTAVGRRLICVSVWRMTPPSSTGAPYAPGHAQRRRGRHRRVSARARSAWRSGADAASCSRAFRVVAAGACAGHEQSLPRVHGPRGGETPEPYGDAAGHPGGRGSGRFHDARDHPLPPPLPEGWPNAPGIHGARMKGGETHRVTAPSYRGLQAS